MCRHSVCPECINLIRVHKVYINVYVIVIIYRVGQKTGSYLKVYNSYIYDTGRHSIHQNIQLFIRSKTGILNVAIIIEYSLHKIKRNNTTPKIPINLSMMFNYYTHFPQN